MSENDVEGEPRERCKEFCQFVDENSAKLIQRDTSVMAIADELRSKGMLGPHEETYDGIKEPKTRQEKMRKLLESLNSEKVKIAFYYLLEKYESHLFEELGPNTSNEQNNPHFNNASTSAPINVVTNIVNERRPYNNINNISFLNKMEWMTPAPKNEKKTLAPKKEKKTPAPKKEKKTPAPKNEKKTLAPKKEKKTPAPKKEKKTPAPKKEKKTPAPKKVMNTPVPKKEKTTIPKKVKTPAPKKVKTPAPKKVKKTAVPKKVKTPAPKKVKKTPAPKKVKKTPAPKKVKKAAARK